MFREEIERLDECIQNSLDTLILIKGIHKIGKTHFINQWAQKKREEDNYCIIKNYPYTTFNDFILDINRDLLSDARVMGKIREPTSTDPIQKFIDITDSIFRINENSNIYIVLDKVSTISREDIDKFKNLDVSGHVHIILLLSSTCGCKLDTLSDNHIRIKCYKWDRISDWYRHNPGLEPDLLKSIYTICWGHIYFIGKCLSYVSQPGYKQNDLKYALVNNVLKEEMTEALNRVKKFLASSDSNGYPKVGSNIYKGIDNFKDNVRSRVLLDIFELLKMCNESIIDPNNGFFKGLEEKYFNTVLEKIGNDNRDELRELIKENAEFCNYLEMDHGQNCLKFYPPFVEVLCKFIEDEYPPTRRKSSLPTIFCCD